MLYVRHAQKIAKLFFSVQSTQFPFKLNILFIKKNINLLGPKTLRLVSSFVFCVFCCVCNVSYCWKNMFVFAALSDKQKVSMDNNTYIIHYVI